MKRLAIASAVCVAFAPVMLEGEKAASGRGGKPNVVVIMTDDQGLRTLRVMDAVRRRLRRPGTTFRSAYATFPLCCPSRATFLTGQYAHNHGVVSNKPPDGGFPAFREAGTLPLSMQEAGYRTGYIGKYLNRYGSRGSNPRYVPRGWDEWRVPIGSSANRLYGYTLNQNGTLRRYPSKGRYYATDVYFRKAARFIRWSSDRPFFLTVATGAPHSEPNVAGRNPRPAPRHRDRFRQAGLPRPPSFDEGNVSDKPEFVQARDPLSPAKRATMGRRYRGALASLLAVDEGVARIVARLRRERKLRDTLLIFTSDNGFLLGEHRLYGKNVLYEESARVPLIVRGPGFPRGVKRRQVVGNIDVAPTILKAAGAAPGRELDGRSLRAFAQDPTVEAGRGLLIEGPTFAAIRTGRYVYAEHDSGELELYDLRHDPYELVSRHNAPGLAGVRAALAQRLHALERCSGAECR